MSDIDWTRAEELFHQARELTGTARSELLAGQTAEVRVLVEDLLRCDADAESAISGAVEGAAVLFSKPQDVGQWKLVRPIGEGGMGSVYLAVRADGTFEKKAAVKFVRTGMDSPSLRLRLEAERRILARFEHPNIARLLDAGATPEGQPYLVMEYVEGRCITEYAEAEKLPPRHRVELFLQVCAAVEYAHRNLVIHRDLKPGNILVDTDGLPRLLDFGIAKLLDPALTTPAGVTQMRAMSFEWASPEQIRGESVTTATDIYSLGAVLFHLLTGELPFKVEGLSALQMERLITDTGVPKMSARQTPFRHQLAGDLDNIVQRAMRRNPADRYASVSHLMADLRRHLAGETVEARDYTTAERLRLFVRRHRIPAAAAAVAVASLVTGTGVALRYAVQADRDRATAISERARAENERERAQLQSDEAARQQRLAESRETDAQFQRAAAETQRSIAERTASAEQTVLDDVISELYANVMNLPGASAVRRASLATVIPALEKLTRDQPANKTAQNLLARAYQRQGELMGVNSSAGVSEVKQGLAFLEKALKIENALLAKEPDSADYLIAINVIHTQLATMLSQLPGESGSVAAHFEQAIAAGRRTVELAPQDPRKRHRLFDALSSRALIDLPHPGPTFQADLTEMRRLAERDLAEQPSDPDTLDRAGKLESIEGQHQTAANNFEAAAKFHTRALGYREKALAARPNDTLLLRSVMLSWNYLANCYRRLDGPASPKVAEAYEKLTAIAERLAAFDPEDFTARYDLAMSLQRLGLFYSETGRPDQALQPAEKSAAIMRGLAKQNALTMSRARNFVQSLLTLGSIHQGGKRTAEAAAAWGEALTTAESLLEAEPRDPNTLMAASRASLYLARGAAGQAALDMAHKSVSFAERLVAAGSTPTREGWLAQARGMAALTLAKGNQRQEATTLAGQSAEAQKRLPPQAFPDWPQAERAEVLALAGQAGPTASN